MEAETCGISVEHICRVGNDVTANRSSRSTEGARARAPAALDVGSVADSELSDLTLEIRGK